MGWIPLIFFFYAIVRAGHERLVRFWSIAAFLCAWLALGDDGGIYQLAYWCVPGLSHFHDPARFLFVTTFALAVMAAVGFELDALRGAPKNALDGGLAACRHCGASLVVRSGLEPGGRSASSLLSPGRASGAGRQAWRSAASAILRRQLQCSTDFGRIFASNHDAYWKRYISDGYRDYGEPDARTIDQFLNSMLPNLAMRYGQQEGGGYEPVSVEAAMNVNDLARIALRRGEPNALQAAGDNGRLHGADAVQRIFRGFPRRPNLPTAAGLPHGLAMYANENRMGRAWLVRRARSIQGHLRVTAALSAPDFRPDRLAILSDRAAGMEPDLDVASAPASVAVASATAHRILLTVDSGSTPALLVYSGVAYPGWRARIDGRRAGDSLRRRRFYRSEDGTRPALRPPHIRPLLGPFGRVRQPAGAAGAGRRGGSGRRGAASAQARRANRCRALAGRAPPGQEREEAVDSCDPFRSPLNATLALLAVLLAIGLRLVALRSDPYAGLSWSSALLTDEGFYTHNARNIALFGHARTDEFSNMLIMPALHYAQALVFRLFGAGSVQARGISVACGLAALPLFFIALRRPLGLRAACLATLFLGLDHVNLLYSRMALMDTPGAFVAVCAFAVWACGIEREGRAAQIRMAAAGALFVSLLAVRGLALIALPAVFVATPREGGPGGSRRTALCAGAAAAAALYLALWWLPNCGEMAHAGHFYLIQQLAPHSLGAAGYNVTNALFGYSQGITAYLLRHSPVLAVLALCGIFAAGPNRSPVERCLALWLIVGVGLLAATRFPAPRYYVLFYPALAGLGAITLDRAAAGRPGAVSRPGAALLAGFLAYHALLLRCTDERAERR